MADKRRVKRGLNRLEDTVDTEHRNDTDGFWTALKAYFDPDRDRTDEPDPMDFAPAADTEAEAKQMLGRSRWGFAARKVAYKVDYGPGDGVSGGSKAGEAAGDNRRYAENT